MTHKDIYTKFMIEYDKAQITSSYPSLTKYEIATILDKAYLALIAQKLTGNNIRGVAFEGDIKAIEDIRPLIIENIFKQKGKGQFTSNEYIYKLPEDMLYYISSLVKTQSYTTAIDSKQHIIQNVDLISHEDANKFRSTYTNLPWMQNPVGFIEGEDLHVLIDPFENKNSGNASLQLLGTYIKSPAKFALPYDGSIYTEAKYTISDIQSQDVIVNSGTVNTVVYNIQTGDAVKNDVVYTTDSDDVIINSETGQITVKNTVPEQQEIVVNVTATSKSDPSVTTTKPVTVVKQNSISNYKIELLNPGYMDMYHFMIDDNYYTYINGGETPTYTWTIDESNTTAEASLVDWKSQGGYGGHYINVDSITNDIADVAVTKAGTLTLKCRVQVDNVDGILTYQMDVVPPATRSAVGNSEWEALSGSDELHYETGYANTQDSEYVYDKDIHIIMSDSGEFLYVKTNDQRLKNWIEAGDVYFDVGYSQLAATSGGILAYYENPMKGVWTDEQGNERTYTTIYNYRFNENVNTSYKGIRESLIKDRTEGEDTYYRMKLNVPMMNRMWRDSKIEMIVYYKDPFESGHKIIGDVIYYKTSRGEYIENNAVFSDGTISRNVDHLNIYARAKNNLDGTYTITTAAGRLNGRYEHGDNKESGIIYSQVSISCSDPNAILPDKDDSRFPYRFYFDDEDPRYRHILCDYNFTKAMLNSISDGSTITITYGGKEAPSQQYSPLATITFTKHS